MQVERKALYNLLRMNWLLEPNLKVMAWQVEDYRALPMVEIFKRLQAKQVELDKVSFIALAEHCDTPEDLTDELLGEAEISHEDEDQIYLLLFELWRRLIPEKPCLSTFCDELDHQIYLYDQGHLDQEEGMQDVLANLQVILDENVDRGGKPLEVFELVTNTCANDIESFLYDFIAEQIDHHNYAYASELIEGFQKYIKDDKWFEFLTTRILAVTDSHTANLQVRQLIKKIMTKPDLEFIFEILTFLVQDGEKEAFVKLAKKGASILQTEEDFRDMLLISADFFHHLDLDRQEAEIKKVLQARNRKSPTERISAQDLAIQQFVKILE
ncbi:hypothetical protein [Parachlamydia sp. AcF125]|uniref:hypothetical protein n=1 Tax=Parachlamydia sp. AcF125 TaxID=2795736 RepID=UPI001BC9BE3D|nr:hypothetical protein [Parachlamydia sp. AcF125]MBS4169064.1 hypothetical protein [Parachlamydia sp. AcF125]